MNSKVLHGMRVLAPRLICALLVFSLSGASAKEVQPSMTQTSAKAAVLIERNTGMVLLQSNEDLPLPMASTTKVMTALMALELGGPEDVVTVGRNAFGVPGTSIYLSLGEKITLHDLLYGLMLASGNDAAVAIAEYIGGDVPTFCHMMTTRAAELGCENTVFINPNGLPVAGHHTTAYDLALIARQAMSHAFFRELVSTRRASIPWEGRSYHRILNNKNRLLAEYEGATGIKTGYTKAAGRCLVFGAKREGLEVIGVVLNCGDWFHEAARLMDLAFERYEQFDALSAGETVRVLPVKDGTQDTVYLCAEQTLCAPVPRGLLPTIEYDMPSEIAAGAHMGDIVGEARLMLEGKTLASTPLVLAQSLGTRTYGFELERIFDLWPMQMQQIAE
ncbi:MAG: D-alanyl-D-alanine carboxypeptidase family protein [Clostridia bacterium]